MQVKLRTTAVFVKLSWWKWNFQDVSRDAADYTELEMKICTERIKYLFDACKNTRIQTKICYSLISSRLQKNSSSVESKRMQRHREVIQKEGLWRRKTLVKKLLWGKRVVQLRLWHRELWINLCIAEHVYEGISRSFRTESITKYTLTKILIQKQHKGLLRQNSLDWLTK